MAWMIPPQIDPESNVPPGEQKLFRELKDDPDTKDWIVLHSLDVAAHRKRISGEVDFVVIIPGMGVLCLEVKSHSSIECINGEWFFGRQREKQRSPFKQVSQTMHSLRAQLVREAPDLNHIVFWSAVVFPFVVFDTASPEWHPWQVIDLARLSRDSIGHLAVKVLRHARSYLEKNVSARWFNPGNNHPTPAECRRIAEVLRPQFEFYESPVSRARRREEEIRYYTEKQTRALDAMAWNPRVAFMGPAGTGKTMLAVEAVRRARTQGRRVLLVCFNRLLGNWMREQVADLAPDVVAGTLHQFLVHLTNYHPTGKESSHFWEKELPEKAIQMLLSDNTGSRHRPFDEIIIDEAQDLLKPAYLDVLDLILDGGLRHGRWLLFGDFVNQNIYAPGSAGTLEMLENLLNPYASGFPIFHLGDNCRNTPRIASFIETSARLTPGYASVLRPDRLEDRDPVLHFYEDHDEQQMLLIQTLESLYRDGYRGEDIVILSTLAAPDSAASCITDSPWKERLKPCGSGGAGYIQHCTIHAFKGLEAPVVIVTDLEEIAAPDARTLFYVAISRAQDLLIILAGRSVQRELLNIITENISS